MTQRAEADEQRIAMAARLRDAREYLGMSQDEVAAAIKLYRPAITNIESGSRKVEAIELDQLAQLYGRTVTYFLSGEQPDQTSSESVAFYARTLTGLSEKDLTEVARFAEFLRTSSASKKSSGRNRE